MTNALDVGGSPADHGGSAFQFGWMSYVDKDPRAVLGKKVDGGLDRQYCGGGDLAQCTAALLGALTEAVDTPAASVYPGDGYCDAADSWCAAAIAQGPLGGITDPLISWQNRPTYEQVVQFVSHR